VDGQPAEVVADRIALAAVHAGAHLHAERLCLGADRPRAADGAGGPLERDEEAVAQAFTARPPKRPSCSRTSWS
jgi:hypothetical protein